MSDGPDLANRDPNGVNAHLKVAFDECFAEPHETIFAFDGVWTYSFKCFNMAKLWCYRILSLLCGVLTACSWGMCFAHVAFCQIWCLMPSCKMLNICMGPIGQCMTIITECCLKPIFSAIGFLFYNIRVSMEK